MENKEEPCARENCPDAGDLMTTKEAAAFLRVSTAFLERDRWSETRVPYIKVGLKAIRYRRPDLEEHIRMNRVKN